MVVQAKIQSRIRFVIIYTQTSQGTNRHSSLETWISAGTGF